MSRIFLKATLEPGRSGQEHQMFLLLLFFWGQLFGAVTAQAIGNAGATAATLHTTASSLALDATAGTVTLASKVRTQTAFVTIIRTGSRLLSQTMAPDNVNSPKIAEGDGSLPLSGADVDVDVNAAGPDLVLRAYQFLTDWWQQGLLACVILAWCVRRYGFWSTLDFLFKQAVVEDTNADAAAPAENDGTGPQDDVGNPGPTNTAHGGDHTCNFQNNGNGNLIVLQGVVEFPEDDGFIQAVSLNPAAVPDETATAQELVESPVHTNRPGPAPQGPVPTAMPRLPPPGPRLLLPSAPNDETTI